MPFPTSELAIETRAIADRLLATPIGEQVTFDQLSEAIGRNVRSKRYLIERARDLALKEAGAGFDSVRGIGYVRQPGSAAHKAGAHARKRIRSTASRGAKRVMLMADATNDISDSDRLKAVAEATNLRLVRLVASDKARAALPEIHDRPQPVGMALKAMMEKFGVTVDDRASEEV